MRRLSARQQWPVDRLCLVELEGIDTALAVRSGEDWAQIMPHGGMRVVQRLIDRLIELGAVYEPRPDPRALYPEADSAVEADALATIAQAASPAAIDLLAVQPELWREALREPACLERRREAILERAKVLDRLITPARVVVAGRPNVGKSTLTNAMLGKAVSVVADLPGTTRDWVGGLAELGGGGDGSAAVAVHWHDTPGLRVTTDGAGVERRAIELAQRVLQKAEVLIAMRDPVTDWPEATDLPREPDLWLVNKVDDAAAPTEGRSSRHGATPDEPLALSAEHDRNLDLLEWRVLEALSLEALPEQLWAFSPPLREAVVRGRWHSLESYVAAG